MLDKPSPKNDPKDHLPDDLLTHLEGLAPDGDLLAAAPLDLSDDGRYAEAYLLLTEDRLGHFTRDNGTWRGDWRAVKDLDDAEIVQGLGMSLLRVVPRAGGPVEFRHTLRHAKAVAKLHRQLERRIEGDGGAGPIEEGGHEDEKKVRCEKCGHVLPSWTDVCYACMNRRKMLFRLLDFVKPYKWWAATAFVIAVILTGMGMVQPWISKPLFNKGLGAAKDTDPDFHLVVYYVVMLVGLMALRFGGQIIQLRLSLGLGTRVSRSIRNMAYAHLQKLSLSFFNKKQTGALVTRVTSDTERVWYFVSSMFIDIVLAFLMLIGVGACLFAMNWRLAIFALMPVPLMFFLIVFFHKRLHRSFRRMWHRWSQMTSVVAGALPGVRVIKAFSQEDREIARFVERSDALFQVETQYIKGVRSLFSPAMMVASGLGSLIVWLLGGWWISQNLYDTSPGELVAFQGFLMMFLRPIHQVAHMDEMFNRAATSASRIFEILDTEPGIYSRKGATPAVNIEGKIELRNVSFSYDGVRRVLKNVSTVIEPGEMLGLAGPSGGGKTTLVNLISRFYDVLEGQILVDGVDVRDYDLAGLRQAIGVVLQEPFLFHGTVAENIAYGKPDATREEIIAASRAANAHEFILGFPDGYDSMVGERGQTLSGGERQRISIARAILNDPKILILDEATSSVDTATEKLIQEALERLTSNRTTIAIAHRLSTLSKADRLLILDKGMVVEEGPHEELAEKEDGLYASLLKMQRESQSLIALSGS